MNKFFFHLNYLPFGLKIKLLKCLKKNYDFLDLTGLSEALFLFKFSENKIKNLICLSKQNNKILTSSYCGVKRIEIIIAYVVITFCTNSLLYLPVKIC